MKPSISCQLLDIINMVRANKQLPSMSAISGETRLREDVGLDSLDLAELTVRIEEAFGVDVFEAGVVRTVGEIHDRLDRRG